MADRLFAMLICIFEDMSFVHICWGNWVESSAKLALLVDYVVPDKKIADIYISISTGTFDIENIKYEKKWQQLDLDTNFEP